MIRGYACLYGKVAKIHDPITAYKVFDQYLPQKGFFQTDSLKYCSTGLLEKVIVLPKP